jgi:hypothetical protein
VRRAALALLAAIAVSAAAAPRATAGPPPGADACPVFPTDNYWHADVTSLPLHPRSDAWIQNMGGVNRRLHPDFGPSDGERPYGIPYEVVDGSRPKVSVVFEYDDESDAGPYPFAATTPIEGGASSDGDRHALMLDRDTCRLYELFYARWNDGAPTAGSGAVYDLRSNALRPAGWTSADAAGLPIFAGLLRRDEVLSGNVDHAIRITAQTTSRAYLWPARHFASSNTNPDYPPMGAWFRLKASFDISRYSPHTQTILRAFKKHGAIVADNGSNWYFTGAADEGWDGTVLDELKSVPAGAFEAVDASTLMVDANSGQVRAATTTPATPPTSAAPSSTAPPSTSSTLPRVPAQPTGRPAPGATTATATASAVGATTTSTEATTTTAAPASPVAALGSIDDARSEPRGRQPQRADDGASWVRLVGLGAAMAATTVAIAVMVRRRRSSGPQRQPA